MQIFSRILKQVGVVLLIVSAVIWTRGLPTGMQYKEDWLPKLTELAEVGYLKCFYASTPHIPDAIVGFYGCPLDGHLNLVVFAALGLLAWGFAADITRADGAAILQRFPGFALWVIASLALIILGAVVMVVLSEHGRFAVFIGGVGLAGVIWDICSAWFERQSFLFRSFVSTVVAAIVLFFLIGVAFVAILGPPPLDARSFRSVLLIFAAVWVGLLIAYCYRLVMKERRKPVADRWHRKRD